MNGPAHYERAEELLKRSRGEDLEWARLLTAQAEVHATLALAASNLPFAREFSTEWRVATQ